MNDNKEGVNTLLKDETLLDEFIIRTYYNNNDKTKEEEEENELKETFGKKGKEIESLNHEINSKDDDINKLTGNERSETSKGVNKVSLKIKQGQNDIKEIKNGLVEYPDKDKLLTVEEHEKIGQNLKDKHKKDLKPFEQEISKFENNIFSNYPESARNKTNSQIKVTNNNDSIELAKAY